MLPFLIFLVAFTMAADAVPAAEATPTPDPRAEISAAVRDIQNSAEKIKGEALTEALESLRETQEEMRAEAGDTARSSSTPSKASKNREHRSADGDMVFAAIPIVAICFTFLYLIVRALMAPFTNRTKQAAQFPPGAGHGFTDEEAALLEKLQRTLGQMESRVESLETILIDQARTEKKYGTKL